MKLWNILGTTVIAGALAMGAVYAAEGGDKPKAEQGEKPAKPEKKPMLKVPGIFKDLPGLTDEQKQKLSDIATKAAADKKAIDEKAKEDSMALLTDEQKAAVKAPAEKAPAEKKPDMKPKLDPNAIQEAPQHLPPMPGNQ